jgi:hypothetical protein
VAQRISDEKVLESTGRNWQDWFDWLNDRDGAKLTHKQIVALIGSDGEVESGWWCQNVTNEFEKHIGRREIGSTVDSDFQIGVQKTLPLDPDATWSLITSPEGARELIGADVPLPTEPGATVASDDGHEYELRTIHPGQRMRFRRTNKDTGDESTVQFTLLPTKTGTSLHFHHEGLSSSEERETMREHWKSIAGKILSIV